MRQNRHYIVKFWKCQKAMSILPHVAKALLQLFCLHPIIFGWKQNCVSGAFASLGKIKNHDLHGQIRNGSGWWFSKILLTRSGSDSILSDQDWTGTEKFHTRLISGGSHGDGIWCAVLPLLFFFTRSLLFCFIWDCGIFIENLFFFYSGQILEMYVVLLYFPFKNTVVSQA